MTKLSNILILALLVAAFLCGIVSKSAAVNLPMQRQQPQRQPSRDVTTSEIKKWEYLSIQEAYSTTLITQCNKLGEEGWEVISVIRSDKNENYLAVLKRPKQ